MQGNIQGFILHGFHVWIWGQISEQPLAVVSSKRTCEQVLGEHSPRVGTANLCDYVLASLLKPTLATIYLTGISLKMATIGKLAWIKSW